MKQNIMMRRMLSRLLVTFFFLLSFVTLSAQNRWHATADVEQRAEDVARRQI